MWRTIWQNLNSRGSWTQVEEATGYIPTSVEADKVRELGPNCYNVLVHRAHMSSSRSYQWILVYLAANVLYINRPLLEVH